MEKNNKVQEQESDRVSMQVPIPKEVSSLEIFSDSQSVDSSITQHDDSNSILEFNDELLPFEEKEYTAEFETSAPEKRETLNSTPKTDETEIVVASNASVHYSNVLSYSDIDESNPKQVRIFWIVNGSEVDIVGMPEFNATLLDTNGNGLIDKVSWNVPRLSEQKFKIKIVKAIDVAIGSKDSGGNVVSAVYDIYADGILAESSGSGVSKLLNLTKRMTL